MAPPLIKKSNGNEYRRSQGKSLQQNSAYNNQEMGYKMNAKNFDHFNINVCVF
jgi:hypothetical protein